MEIGVFLSYRRKQLGLSLSDVGSVIGYTPQAIYRYEKGNVKIDLSLVEPFCSVLDLSLESFFKMDPQDIKPYQGEKFVQERFSSLLKQVLSEDPSLTAKAASSLSVSPTRVEKWAEGTSLPSVEEFLVLSKAIGYDPVDLYLGRPKLAVAHKPSKPKATLIVPLSVIALSVSVLTPILVSRYARPADEDHSDSIDSSSSYDSITPIKEKCEVVVQGYDNEDLSPISSIRYRFEVNKGDSLPKPELKSDYYDYVHSELDGNVFAYGSTPIEQDVTIRALFEKKTFTVTFLGYNDEVLSVSKTRYLSDAISPSVVEDRGDFRFVRWKEDFTKVKKDLMVHSIFSRFRSNLLLDFDGGEEEGEGRKEVLDYSADLYESLPKPKKKGHRFTGYFDSKGVRFDKNYSLTSETTTLHAAYEPLTYQMHLDGFEDPQNVTYGTAVTSLPTLTKDNEIILGWKNGEEKVTLPFIYEEDTDITLTPTLASEYFDYVLEDGKIVINRVVKWGNSEIDLTSVGPYPVTKVCSHALKGNTSIESIVLKQRTVTLETSCFEDLASLKRVTFDSVDTSSIFEEGIFRNCSNVIYLRSGIPTKNGLTILKLKEYGLTGGSDFVFEFNEATKAYPTSWNDDFGVLGELRMGEGIQGMPDIQSNGCKILRFVPGRVGYSLITLNLPDLEQDELRFYGTSLVRIEGETFGKVRRFVMDNGGVAVGDRSKPLEVEEFDMSSSRLVALGSQTIKANRVLLSDRVSDGYFAPLTDELQVDFYGCEEAPSALVSRSAFSDANSTRLSFHSEKRYNDDDLLEIPLTMADWLD